MPNDSTTDPVAMHEAAHAVACRVLNIGITRCAVDHPPGVRSRVLRGDTRAEKFATLMKVAAVDLAPAYVDSSRVAIAADLKNAERHCREAAGEKYGDDLSDDDLSDKAAALLKGLRSQVAALVRANLEAIERVAAALAEAGELTEQDVDELMDQAGDQDRAGAELET